MTLPHKSLGITNIERTSDGTKLTLETDDVVGIHKYTGQIMLNGRIIRSTVDKEFHGDLMETIMYTLLRRIEELEK